MLSRELLQQQNKLNLLNTISLRLLPALATFSDYDGLINISEEQLKELGYMTKKLVPKAIEGLLNIGWLRRSKDGKLYCLYVCNTTSENKGFYYINLYKIFKKDTFKSMYKRRIILLYYILTSKIPGTWHSIAVERLYKNKTLSDKLALRIFDDFDDLMNNLIPLIEAGIIEIRLGKEHTILTKNSPRLKERIYTFCGKDNKSSRKKRMRGEKDGHIIHIRVTDDVLKEKTTIFDADRRSTLRDLEMVASRYDYSLDVFPQEALEEVHMVKHKIYKEFGNLGISIYRDSLQSFFEYNSHSFARLMEAKEFGKVIKNYYVLPRIKMELTNLIKKLETEQNLYKTEAFLRYFTSEAYPDDLVVFDHYLNTSHADLYKKAKEINTIWKQFSDKVEDIYAQEAALGHTREVVLDLSMKGVLTNKKHIEEEIKQKTRIVKKRNTQEDSSRPETPKEIREYKEKLRARGLLKQDIEIKDIKFDF